MTLLLVIVGFILDHNGQWFNGAHALGHWLLWIGIGLFVLEAFFWIAVLIYGGKTFKRL